MINFLRRVNSFKAGKYSFCTSSRDTMPFRSNCKLRNIGNRHSEMSRITDLLLTTFIGMCLILSDRLSTGASLIRARSLRKSGHSAGLMVQFLARKEWRVESLNYSVDLPSFIIKGLFPEQAGVKNFLSSISLLFLELCSSYKYLSQSFFCRNQIELHLSLRFFL